MWNVCVRHTCISYLFSLQEPRNSDISAVSPPGTQILVLFLNHCPIKAACIFLADSRIEARKMQEEPEVYIVVPESEEVPQN